MNAIQVESDTIYETTFEDDLAYLKMVEQEFMDGVDDLLKKLDLSHLRIQPIKEVT